MKISTQKIAVILGMSMLVSGYFKHDSVLIICGTVFAVIGVAISVIIDGVKKSVKAETKSSNCHSLTKTSYYPSFCPVTGLPFFMEIEHPEKGMVPTYGGPYDSYTIPEMEDSKAPIHNRELYRERFDHDAGYWKNEIEIISLRIIEEHYLFKMENEIASCQRILFEMWHMVEIGQQSSRSPFGDKVLELKSAIYENEQDFFKDYEKYEIKMGY